MNAQILEAQRRQLAAEHAEVTSAINSAIATKSYAGLPDLEKRLNQLEADRAEFALAEKRFNASAASPLGMDAASAAGHATGASITRKGMGNSLNPLHFAQDSLEAVFKAASARQSLSTKAFSTVEGLIPAQLDPAILGKVHESRLLDHLPAQAISAPSYEIMVHASTTGAPAPTGEGAPKPEVVLNMTSQVLTAIKIAANVGISYESLSDFPTFMGYAVNELTREVIDVENAQLLSGSGTSGNMAGFLSTTGILTHDASTDTGSGVTAIDSLEKSITALRVGSALAEADLLVLNPSTWSAIRRLKDSTGRFLFISADSDPTRTQGDSLFGVPVLTTTALTAGAGLMLDTRKFGKVLIREGITIHTGTNTDDFTKNISRFVVEERIVLAVERPAAVMSITNLPTA
jgi:HK97 family phage major capsid protein